MAIIRLPVSPSHPANKLLTVKLVHKDPPLDLVGWYTLVPKSGPSSHHLPIHSQFLEASKESTVLLGFHTEDVLHPAAGNPLPLTIYESNMEAEDSSGESQAEGEDKEMKDLESPAKMVLKFRELPFTTETGDAEMIAMQFIREGGANATVEDSKRPLPEPATNPNTKGKQRALSKEEEAKAKAEAASQAPKDAVLSKEDSELISALQAKANAVKMMKARLGLLISYLERLPPEPFTGLQTSTDALAGQDVAPSYNILRQIQALVTNVEVVTPRQQDALEKEMLQESNDVKLISLVKDLLSSVSEIREVGKKFAITDIAQAQKPPRRAYDSAMNQKLSVGEIINQKLVIGDAGDLHFG